MMNRKTYLYSIPLIVLLSFLCFPSGATNDPDQGQRLNMEEYLNRVGNQNLEYIAEKFNIDIADAEIIAARVLPDPEIEFEAGEEYYSVELSYTIEFGNKRRNRVRVAKGEAEIERLSVEHFFRELRAEAADAFLEALKEKDILEFRRSSYEYMYQLSLSDSIRFKLGEITENDARQSRLEAASLLNEVYEQEAAYLSALAILNYYMGNPGNTFFTPEGTLDINFRDVELAFLLDRARVHRVDRMVALKSSEVARNRLKLIQAERKIDMDLMVGYERDWKGFFPERDMLKAGFSIPIPFSNTNKGALKIARYEIEKSNAEARNTELQIEVEVVQAYHTYQSMKKQVEQYRTVLLEEAQKLLDGIVYKYQRGETDILEVLIAQRTYNEIREQYLETLKNYHSSLIELERATGTVGITEE